MSEIRKKKRLRRVFTSPLSLLVLLVVCVLVARGTYSIYLKAERAKEARNDVDRELTELLAREIFLESEVKKLETESGIEQEIRERYGLGKPGESLAIIVDSAHPEASQLEDRSMLAGVYFWFMGLFK